MTASKAISSAVIIIAVFVIWFFLIVISGLGGSPHATGIAWRLAVLPVLVAVPLLAAIHISGEDKSSKQTRYVVMAIFSPLIGGVVLFLSEISESFREHSRRTAILSNYYDAKNLKEQDPVRAYLACMNAEFYHHESCDQYLDSVSDPAVCGSLCEVPMTREGGLHPHCKENGYLLAVSCAEIMVRKFNDKKPVNACKLAGLMNLKVTDDYWHGFYIECLKHRVKVHTHKNGKNSPAKDLDGDGEDQNIEIRTLAEALGIDVESIPNTTKTPLPE